MWPTLQVLVTTFETAIVDVKFLSMFDWQAVVVDEGHRLKGESSKLKTALQVALPRSPTPPHYLHSALCV